MVHVVRPYTKVCLHDKYAVGCSYELTRMLERCMLPINLEGGPMTGKPVDCGGALCTHI